MTFGKNIVTLGRRDYALPFLHKSFFIMHVALSGHTS